MRGDKCLMKSRTTLSSLAVGFSFFIYIYVIAGFKNKSFHPHLHMPPLLQRSTLTIITSCLLYVPVRSPWVEGLR